jgi:uncharacterized protein YkwD
MSFDDLKAKAFNAINQYREKHGVEPLDYSEKLSIMAQSHAAKLAEGDMLYHSLKRSEQGLKLGENIAMIYGYNTPAETVCKLWYDCIQKHNFDLNELQIESACFSQVRFFAIN